ncbi:hypothetical protein CENSYa_1831 [Cenarchaeum symbiosum A]|uniref:Copper binding protein, plastocyanin/azurin family n=1 Tax=Cenarchaeum symbiosum (strain A) TaxID=414004 RepID=A0RYM4_CENSY|nr:hypothetical protein CENSYa_1831 [Cenarchaeum symbiosum A]
MRRAYLAAAVVIIVAAAVGYVALSASDVQNTPVPVSQNEPAAQDTTEPVEGDTPAHPAGISTTNDTIVHMLGDGHDRTCEECFDKAHVTASPGVNITWYNDSPVSHTLASGLPDKGPDGAFETGTIMPGETYTLDTGGLETGHYPYYCIDHPWEKGRVEVRKPGIDLNAPIWTGVPIFDNEEPELDAYLNGTAVYGPIQAASDAVSLLVLTSDPDGDLVTIGVIPDDLPPAAVSVSDHGNGTATILIDVSSAGVGTYAFRITASDGIDTVREPYEVAVPLGHYAENDTIVHMLGDGHDRTCEECFDKAHVTASPGVNITWYNDSPVSHTLASGLPDKGPDGAFETGTIMPGETYTLDTGGLETGHYPYYCIDHPWEKGRVEVRKPGPDLDAQDIWFGWW